MNRLSLAVGLSLLFAARLAGASTSGVVVSQVYGGNGSTYASDYVELFNAGSSAVNITGWSVQYASATGTGNFANNGVVSLSGTLQPGQYYLVQLTTTTGPALPAADASGSINLSGTAGKVALVSSTTGLACNGGSTACSAAQLAQIVDLVGYGTANFYEGAVAPAASSTTALFRQAAGCTDTNANGSDFTTGAPAPRNSATALSACGGGGGGAAALVASCPAASVASGMAGTVSATATDADSVVNSAVPGAAWPSGFSIGSFTPAGGDGGVASLSITVSAALASGTYGLPIQWGNDDAQSASCTLNVTVMGLTAIPSIQGSGATSPFVGQTVTTRGVVTKLTSNGFYLQDPVGDGNPATSDGLFVFTSAAPTVSVGQYLQLSGTVAEFNTGAASNADTLAHTVTELTNPGSVSVIGSGYAVAPTPVVLPTATIDELERYEGMLVTVTGPSGAPLTVSQNYFLGRYGQLTLSAGGRLQTPTNAFRPGSADALSLASQNARSTILLDDGTSMQNPNPTPYIGADNTVRAGDSVTSVTGVIDFGLATSSNTGFGLYKIHPVATPSITRVNARTSSPAAVGGTVKVASFNVLNYFTTFTDGTTATGQTGQGCSLGGLVSAGNCRGADSAAEFSRQRTKIIAALAAINADAVGLMEIQNNGNTAVQNLVDGLNTTLGAGTYAAVPLPAAGTGTDAIRVAMIYKPAKLSLVGASLSDTHAVNNRPTLAQTFAAANGERFSVVVNHFKSKGSCPDAGTDPANEDSGDGQGCWNQLRVQQAQQLRTFIGSVQTTGGTNDVLVIGDLNAYAKEDPVDDLTSNGYVDQIDRFNAFGYSYVFDGGAGRLDHAIATPSLSPKVTGALEWHINADEPSVIDYNVEFKQPACAGCGPDYYTASPYRASDHDPVVLGLALYKSLVGTAGRDALVGTAGDDLIEGGEGADTLTGNGGADVFVYRSLRDAGDTITDFLPGTDRIDLSALLASIGQSAGGAFGNGVVRLVASGANTVLQIDADGSAGPALPRSLLTLRGVTPAQIVPARDLGLQ